MAQPPCHVTGSSIPWWVLISLSISQHTSVGLGYLEIMAGHGNLAAATTLGLGQRWRLMRMAQPATLLTAHCHVVQQQNCCNRVSAVKCFKNGKQNSDLEGSICGPVHHFCTSACQALKLPYAESNETLAQTEGLLLSWSD